MLELAAHCQWVDLDDIVFVLDTRRGEYFALPPKPSRLWLELSRAPLALDHSNPDELSDLMAEIESNGWRSGGPVTSGVETSFPRRSASGARAWGCLVISHMLLKHRGFHAAYEWARGHRNHASAGAADLAAARRSFKRAEHVLPPRLGLNDCLPRSLALYAFLAGAGIGVTHRIGVKRYPFGAHAWVEHEAKPVVASEASVAPFKIIASL